MELAEALRLDLGAWYRLPADERDLWVARWERRSETCPEHGMPRSVCGDPDKLWYPQRRVDYAAMERAAAATTYQRLHKAKPWHDGTFTKWAKAPSDGFPYHFDMGVTIDVAESDENPGDLFLSRESAVPGAQQADRQQHGAEDAGDDHSEPA